MTRPIDKNDHVSTVLPICRRPPHWRDVMLSGRCMIPDGERSHQKRTLSLLTCNRWRRTGNIANSTTANSMSENTEMSSGNRDASTTDADVAALIERTDVRLEMERSCTQKGENDGSDPMK